jgi:hypothetical protein
MAQVMAILESGLSINFATLLFKLLDRNLLIGLAIARWRNIVAVFQHPIEILTDLAPATATQTTGGSSGNRGRRTETVCTTNARTERSNPAWGDL